MSTLTNFRNNNAKVSINNSYINDNTCGIPSNNRKRQISHILDTLPTHTTEYNKKKFS